MQARSGDNGCDMAEELCDGDSAECPPDTFFVEGTACAEDEGYCYGGACSTMEAQCSAAGTGYGAPTEDEPCGYTPHWQVADGECAAPLQCLGQLVDLTDGSRCQAVGVYAEDGTPCSDSDSDGEARQCVDGLCQRASTMATVK